MQRMVERVAFLFLTIEGLSKEEFWKTFFENADPTLYRIYCHPKYPDRVPNHSVVRNHIISEHVHTSWASISLVSATILLLKAAVMDEQTTRFMLVSDSCIPIIPFANLYQQVMNQPCSSFQYNPNYIQSVDIHGRYKRFKNKKLIPMERFMKAHQWFILDRRAAVLCADGPHLHDFDRVFAADEHYFINICNHYKLPYMNKKRTFVEFEYERSHPRVFHELSRSFIRNLCNNGFFFMRKIKNPTIFLP